METHPIDAAARIVGSQAALAALLGVTKAAVNQWKDPKRMVPLEHCVAIETASRGVVMRWHLRPTDWFRIWPELIGIQGAPAIPSPANDEDIEGAPEPPLVLSLQSS